MDFDLQKNMVTLQLFKTSKYQNQTKIQTIDNLNMSP